jgi:hypothetical protein
MMKYSAYSNIVLGKTWRTEAKAFLLRADATGENRPVAWDSYFNQYIDNLIVYGFFGKMDTFVNTTGGIGIGTATSKLNIIQNAYNALGVNNPNYVAGTGYNTTGTQYINTQFNPTSANGHYTQDSASWGFMLSGNQGSGTRIHGAYIETTLSYLGVYANCAFNASGEDVGHAAVIGYNCLTRPNSTGYSLLKNAAIENITHGSGSRPNGNFYQLCCDVNGTASYFSASTEVLKNYFHGESITQQIFLDFQTYTNLFYSQTC